MCEEEKKDIVNTFIAETSDINVVNAVKGMAKAAGRYGIQNLNKVLNNHCHFQHIVISHCCLLTWYTEVMRLKFQKSYVFQ